MYIPCPRLSNLWQQTFCIFSFSFFCCISMVLFNYKSDIIRKHISSKPGRKSDQQRERIPAASLKWKHKQQMPNDTHLIPFVTQTHDHTIIQYHDIDRHFTSFVTPTHDHTIPWYRYTLHTLCYTNSWSYHHTIPWYRYTLHTLCYTNPWSYNTMI